LPAESDETLKWKRGRKKLQSGQLNYKTHTFWDGPRKVKMSPEKATPKCERKGARPDMRSERIVRAGELEKT